MNKSDLKEIKDIVDSALGTHLASVHEELTDLRRDMDERFAEVDVKFTGVEGALDRLEAKIDHVDDKLGNFEIDTTALATCRPGRKDALGRTKRSLERGGQNAVKPDTLIPRPHLFTKPGQVQFEIRTVL